MDDYSALAHRIAGGLADVRGCLILSRDGLIVGSYPEDESAVKQAWLRFAALGDPERSFVEFGAEVWAYHRRGPYAAFAVAGSAVRPGLLLDQLEQVLLGAEDMRTHRDTLRLPEPAGTAPSGKPRTPLHPPSDRPEAVPQSVLPPAARTVTPESRPWSRGSVPVSETPTDDPGGSSSDPAPGAGGARPGEPRSAGSSGQVGGVEPASEDTRTGGRPAQGDRIPGGEGQAVPSGLEMDSEAEVDRVLLAKEFSGLLQVEGDDDEAHS
jgi:hypothetical protein